MLGLVSWHLHQSPSEGLLSLSAPTEEEINPLRVLVVAANASAKWGGEAILPLHIFRGLRAKGYDARLCVGAETKPELDECLGLDRERVAYVQDGGKHAFFRWLDAHSPQWIAPRYTYYYLSVLSTLLRQRRMVLRLIETYKIQIVHQPTPVSPKAPSFLFGLPVPLVVGPMNGGMEYPPGFRHLEARGVRAIRSIGRFFAGWANRIAPGKLQAARLLVANERTARSLPSHIRGVVARIPENGVELGNWCHSRVNISPARSFKLIFIGRLEAWKGAQWLLQAFAHVSKRLDAQLTVVGEFRDARSRLHEEADRLGIASRVDFVGWVSQPRCAELMTAADVLVLPSIFRVWRRSCSRSNGICKARYCNRLGRS